MKKWIHGTFYVLLPCCAAILAAIFVIGADMPEQFNVVEGNDFRLNGPVSAAVTPEILSAGSDVQAVSALSAGSNYSATLRLFGIFPIKTVDVRVVDAKMVVPCGIPFGIKLFSDGVMVVGVTDIDTSIGPFNPAQRAGIKKGDIIESIDGVKVASNQDVAKKIEESGGKALRFRVRRNGISFDVQFTPVKSMVEDRYKAGLWVRDSSAGIGTLTFYSPYSGNYAGLGHPICDVDTGDIIPAASGEIVPARIYDVTKGMSGTPGELRGGFEQGSYGGLSINCETGVYGSLTGLPVNRTAVPVTMKQDVKLGYAQILCTVSGTEPRLYDISIEQVKYADGSPTRNMVISITDPELLAVTGGIVQGMSGSPILQDGALVGAVTHVFVDDPKKGYAIFAENMLKTIETLPKSALEPAA